MIAKRIQVIGKVQNVGFRFYTKKKAIELGLNGFVKNVMDGSVYIEAMGEEAAIDEFIIWCHSDPQWARVEDVKVQEIPLIDRSAFCIK